MAFSKTVQISLAVAAFGTLAFIFGIVAENKKPALGTPITGKDVIICKYPSDPTVALGVLSCLSLPVTAAMGLLAIYFPYNGKSVPSQALFRSTTLSVFFAIAVGVSVFAEGMMMWATITEGLHRSRNVHHNMSTGCPTAKTGLFGGAAFLALDAALFWLICQMLTMNARSDYFDDEDPKGDYGQVVTSEYNGNTGNHNTV